MNIFTSDPDTWEVQAVMVQWEARQKHAHCPLPTPPTPEKNRERTLFTSSWARTI